MLKILPTIDFENKLQTKCGEIFHHSFSNFTIYCTFCDVKFFQFEDFVLHLQNVHLDNNSLKIENKANDEGYTNQNELNLLKTEDNLVNEDHFVETDGELEGFQDEEEEIQKVLKDNYVEQKKKSPNKEEFCGRRSKSKTITQNEVVS